MLKASSFLLTSIFFLLSLTSSYAQQSQTGEATYYADKYQGRKTASGELYDRNKYTAAHRTLPFGALVQVTNLKNNKTVIVKINDMGPSKESRIIDLSYAAAEAIGLVRMGVAQVQLTLLDEYPTASSPYAVGPVIGPGASPQATSSTDAPASGAAAQRVPPSQVPASKPSSSNDFVLPNIRPAGASSTPATSATSAPASTMRTSNPATTPTQASGNKGLGLFEFFAQRVSAQGYGVQVGAFADYRNAVEATATLSNQGINDFLLHTTNNNEKVVFKLIVGPFNSRGAAESFQKKLSLIPGMGKGLVLNLNSIKP